MIPRSATAQSLAREADRNMLKQLDRILEEWNRRFAVNEPPQAKPGAAKKAAAKKK